MNKESTLYDYTKSAEELRQFELGETCSRIIHEYERFNLENDVYKMFGKWPLEKAKTGYSAAFSWYDLENLLKSRGLKSPESFSIESDEKNYGACKQFRMISSGREFGRYCLFNARYSVYTLWKIAQAYNCKNGCVVTDISCDPKIYLNWSKDAQDCITHEKWREKAEQGDGVDDWISGMAVVGLIFGSVSSLILAFLGWMSLVILLCTLLGCVFVFIAIGLIWIRTLVIKGKMDKYAEDFERHCQNIQDAKRSEYDVSRTYSHIW